MYKIPLSQDESNSRFPSETTSFTPLKWRRAWCYLQKCLCLHTAHTEKTSKISSIRGSNIQMSIKNNPQQHFTRIYCIYISIVCISIVAYLLTLLIFIKMEISNTLEIGKKSLEKCRLVGHRALFVLPRFCYCFKMCSLFQ